MCATRRERVSERITERVFEQVTESAASESGTPAQSPASPASLPDPQIPEPVRARFLQILARNVLSGQTLTIDHLVGWRSALMLRVEMKQRDAMLVSSGDKISLACQDGLTLMGSAKLFSCEELLHLLALFHTMPGGKDEGTPVQYSGPEPLDETWTRWNPDILVYANTIIEVSDSDPHPQEDPAHVRRCLVVSNAKNNKHGTATVVPIIPHELPGNTRYTVRIEDDKLRTRGVLLCGKTGKLDLRQGWFRFVEQIPGKTLVGKVRHAREQMRKAQILA